MDIDMFDSTVVFRALIKCALDVGLEIRGHSEASDHSNHDQHEHRPSSHLIQSATMGPDRCDPRGDKPPPACPHPLPFAAGQRDCGVFEDEKALQVWTTRPRLNVSEVFEKPPREAGGVDL